MRSDVTTRKTKNPLFTKPLAQKSIDLPARKSLIFSRENPLIFSRENPLIFSRENDFIFSREKQASKAFKSSRARKPSYYYNFH